MGELGILNVGAGDVKVTFDKNNPAEVIRGSRIVKDMLRRGYALLVEVDRDGQKRFERAIDFDENTAEYIIADFDPVTAAIERKKERDAAIQTIERELSKPLGELVGPKEQESEHGKVGSHESNAQATGTAKPGRRGRRSISASSTRAVAVGRSAGG